MSEPVLIRRASLIDPVNAIDGVYDLLLENGVVSRLSAEPSVLHAPQVIEGEGKWVFPGVIDLGAYVREQPRVATVASESAAAVSAGITRLCCMPEPSKLTDTVAGVNLIKEKAEQTGLARFEVIGAMTAGLEGRQLSNMGGLKKSGCVAVSQGHQPFVNLDVMGKAMEYAQGCGLTMFMQPLEYELIGKGCAHAGPMATRLGLPGIPIAAETVAIHQILILAGQTGASVHFCRLSSAAGVELIRQAKAGGAAITADVAIHQLLLTEQDIQDYDSLCYTLPPLRSEQDRDALREAVRDGVIDAICSDHQPHDLDGKLAPFQGALPGMSGLESLLPLTMRLVEEGVFDEETAISRLSADPARIINKRCGQLSEGSVADLVIYDPDEEWEFYWQGMKSGGRNTPFSRTTFTGRVTPTMIGGVVA